MRSQHSVIQGTDGLCGSSGLEDGGGGDCTPNLLLSPLSTIAKLAPATVE
jgi:hypothetical protein